MLRNQLIINIVHVLLLGIQSYVCYFNPHLAPVVVPTIHNLAALLPPPSVPMEFFRQQQQQIVQPPATPAQLVAPPSLRT